jgi:hypothetical protein
MDSEIRAFARRGLRAGGIVLALAALLAVLLLILPRP